MCPHRRRRQGRDLPPDVWQTQKTIPMTPADYKGTSGLEWLSDVDSYALLNVQLNLEKARSDYFSGDKGKPRYKKKHCCRDTYTTNFCKNNIRFEGAGIRLPKIADPIRLSMHIPVRPGGQLKNVTVTHEPDEKWYFSITFEYPAEEAEPSFGLRQFFKTGGRDAVSAIGLDMSVPFLYVDNTGKKPSYEINRDEIRFIKQYRKLELKMIDGIPYVKLPKIGNVRFILPRGKTLIDIQPQEVSIKGATVSREPDGSYRIFLRMESVIDKPVFPTVINAREIVSVDLGLKEFGVFGNLEESVPVPNPRWIQVHAKRLRRFQQSLSRKQYDQNTHRGSKNWEKARAKVAKEQRKTADQRRDFHHKLSRAIADNYVAFICEDLAVKNMMQNRHLSKSIASVGWSQFLTMVQYKMERAGKYFRKISRWYPSSQTCGCCGYKNTDVKDLGVRKWICPKCGTWHDRDVNAQQNIYKLGAKMLQDEGIQIAGLPVTNKHSN